MEDNRTVVEVDAPPEAPLPGSSWIGVALFPFSAVAGLALGLTYGMPWLITSSLAISLALLAVVGSTFVNRRGRAGVLRLDLHGDGVRIGPGPLARWLPITAGALALVAILVDIGLRIGGFFAEESGGLTFSLMIAAVIGWGLFDGYHGLTNPPGLLLTPRYEANRCPSMLLQLHQETKHLPGANEVWHAMAKKLQECIDDAWDQADSFHYKALIRATNLVLS